MQATDLPAKPEDVHCGPAAGPTNGIRMACTHETMTSFARILSQIGGWEARRRSDRPAGRLGFFRFEWTPPISADQPSPITEA